MHPIYRQLGDHAGHHLPQQADSAWTDTVKVLHARYRAPYSTTSLAAEDLPAVRQALAGAFPDGACAERGRRLGPSRRWGSPQGGRRRLVPPPRPFSGIRVSR